MLTVTEDRTLQIRVAKDDGPRPGWLFEPQEGKAAAVVASPLGGADAVAATVEPEGGSPRPITASVLKAEL
jgi:anti-sigma-K factor RskA